MNIQLMQIAGPVVDLLVQLRAGIKAGRDMSPDALRRTVVEGLENMESQMLSAPLLQNKVAPVKQVLVYFADEVILASGWAHAGQWRETLLEYAFFKTRLGGEKFYEMIDEHQGDPEMAELFYTCLSLGFLGKYRINPTPIAGIRENLYARFAFRLPDDERRLSPGAELVHPGQTSTLPRMFGVWTLVVVSFVSLGLYVVTSQLIWNNIADGVGSVCKLLGIPS